MFVYQNNKEPEMPFAHDVWQAFGRIKLQKKLINTMEKITTLDVKKLTSCGSDWETNQYTLLSKIKDWSSQLHKNKLFPALQDSIQLQLNLEEILRENIESKIWFDNEIRARRFNERFTVYEKAHQVGFQLDRLLEFTEWALKLNKPVMEEGNILKKFVEENISVKKITEENNFKGKGYFLLPDNKKEVLNIYFYDLNWDWESRSLLHSIQTTLLRSIPFGLINNSGDELMYDFIKYSQELYEPVVFIFETDLDFPYNETIFPVAEEILISLVRS